MPPAFPKTLTSEPSISCLCWVRTSWLLNFPYFAAPFPSPPILQTRRVLRELESDMLALRSFKNQKEADLAELRNHNAQLLSALEAVPGGSAAAAAAALPLTLMQQQQRIQVR